MPKFTFDLAEFFGSALVIAHDHGFFNAHINEAGFHTRASTYFIVIIFFTPTYSRAIMQLITRKVMATMDMVILKLSDLDKSIATPELVRA